MRTTKNASGVKGAFGAVINNSLFGCIDLNSGYHIKANVNGGGVL